VLNPLSSMLTTDELCYTVTDAGARVVIGAADKAGQLRDAEGPRELSIMSCSGGESQRRTPWRWATG
jgi:hypothetical protein